MSDPIQNRRKHVRVYRNFILSYRLKAHESVKYEMSQVNNISRGGINFSSTMPLHKGDELLIELKTPFLNEKVIFEGVVHESTEKIPKLIYSIRLEFKNLTDQAKDVLVKIEQYSAQQGQ